MWLHGRAGWEFWGQRQGNSELQLNHHCDTRFTVLDRMPVRLIYHIVGWWIARHVRCEANSRDVAISLDLRRAHRLGLRRLDCFDRPLNYLFRQLISKFSDGKSSFLRWTGGYSASCVQSRARPYLAAQRRLQSEACDRSWEKESMKRREATGMMKACRPCRTAEPTRDSAQALQSIRGQCGKSSFPVRNS